MKWLRAAFILNFTIFIHSILGTNVRSKAMWRHDNFSSGAYALTSNGRFERLITVTNPPDACILTPSLKRGKCYRYDLFGCFTSTLSWETINKYLWCELSAVGFASGFWCEFIKRRNEAIDGKENEKTYPRITDDKANISPTTFDNDVVCSNV